MSDTSTESLNTSVNLHSLLLAIGIDNKELESELYVSNMTTSLEFNSLTLEYAEKAFNKHMASADQAFAARMVGASASAASGGATGWGVRKSMKHDAANAENVKPVVEKADAEIAALETKQQTLAGKPLGPSSPGEGRIPTETAIEGEAPMGGNPNVRGGGDGRQQEPSGDGANTDDRLVQEGSIQDRHHGQQQELAMDEDAQIAGSNAQGTVDGSQRAGKDAADHDQNARNVGDASGDGLAQQEAALDQQHQQAQEGNIRANEEVRGAESQAADGQSQDANKVASDHDRQTRTLGDVTDAEYSGWKSEQAQLKAELSSPHNLSTDQVAAKRDRLQTLEGNIKDYDELKNVGTQLMDVKAHRANAIAQERRQYSDNIVMKWRAIGDVLKAGGEGVAAAVDRMAQVNTAKATLHEASQNWAARFAEAYSSLASEHLKSSNGVDQYINNAVQTTQQVIGELTKVR